MRMPAWRRFGVAFTSSCLAAGVLPFAIGGDGAARVAVRAGDGAAWLPSDDGVLRLVDGRTGRLAGSVAVAEAGSTLAVAQVGSDALVAVPDEETVLRVVGASQALTDLPGGGYEFEGVSQVLAGREIAYVPQPQLQQVQAIDPTTLATVGPPASFPGSDFDAVVDLDDVLWLVDRDSGTLRSIDAGGVASIVEVAPPHHDLQVVMVDGDPVVVDRTAATVWAHGASGSVCLDVAPGAELLVSGSNWGQGWLLVVVPEAGWLLAVDVRSSTCASPIRVGDAGATYGPPVEAEGRVFVPVISEGRIVVVDPTTGGIVRSEQVVDPGTDFQLLVHDGIVFYNAVSTAAAGIVDGDGGITQVPKFGEGGGGNGTGTAPFDPEAEPEARCDADPREAAVDEPITYSVEATGDRAIATAAWRFDDGSTETGLSPTHPYSEPGEHAAEVIVRDAGGRELVVAACPRVTVHDDDTTALAADIEVPPGDIVVGQTVTFRDGSTGAPTTWHWSLAGARPSASQAQHPEVVFSEAGSHAITLEVGRGDETSSVAVEVRVVEDGGPTGSCSVLASSPTVGSSGGFVYQPDGWSPTRFEWTLTRPDGSETTTTTTRAALDVVFDATGPWSARVDAGAGSVSHRDDCGRVDIVEPGRFHVEQVVLDRPDDQIGLDCDPGATVTVELSGTIHVAGAPQTPVSYRLSVRDASGREIDAVERTTTAVDARVNVRASIEVPVGAVGAQGLTARLVPTEPERGPVDQSFAVGCGPARSDRDHDGAPDELDNCPDDPNEDQADVDGDGDGDVCDDDDDGDRIADDRDNCPTASNPTQADADADRVGDACDRDGDNDGLDDAADNCANDPNPSQENADGDSQGNECDGDDDDDGIADSGDNCPVVTNLDQLDADGDHVGDACDGDTDGDGVENATDNCPGTGPADQGDTDGDRLGNLCDEDDDGDSLADAVDNCPLVVNDQANADGDAFGDVCEPNSDGDDLIDDQDNCPLVSNADQANTTDVDGSGGDTSDGEGDACDDDLDNDGARPDASGDNCPTFNPDQLNTDGALDGGDACDGDDDNDGALDTDDNCPVQFNDQLDDDADGLGDACDQYPTWADTFGPAQWSSGGDQVTIYYGEAQSSRQFVLQMTVVTDVGTAPFTYMCAKTVVVSGEHVTARDCPSNTQPNGTITFATVEYTINAAGSQLRVRAFGRIDRPEFSSPLLYDQTFVRTG
jgi:hypothetical protein